MKSPANRALQESLRRRVTGAVMFDDFSRGRYATDASIYQVMPIGVVVPETFDDVRESLAIARDAGVSVLPRGGGTSQCGQTVNESIVIDGSRHLNKLIELDVNEQRCSVEPGIVLDELNRLLKPHGLWFPVDVSTSSRATIGGMTGNNSCGARSIRYGTMRDNVIAINALRADGVEQRFAAVSDNEATDALTRGLLNLGSREAIEIDAKFPKLMRRVGGYNLDALVRSNQAPNLSHLLVGSEGTLAYSKSIELKLSPMVTNKTLGICHFPTFYQAMQAAQHIVKLGPQAVELVDDTMIELAREINMFAPIVDQFVRGQPAAVLLVEFGDDNAETNLTKLKHLEQLIGDLGFTWSGNNGSWGGVVRAEHAGFQSQIWEVRKAGLNIMMSMKQEGKPISFVEDCAVELPDLADFTAQLTELFHQHGTRGTWYAHASVGCLHVRPVLNLKLEQDLGAMRTIAEKAFEIVRSYRGSHSGEHGDGIVRSEFHEVMFGRRMVENFREVKSQFDPHGLFNPNRIVDPPKMDDRRLLRFHEDYVVKPFETELDWSSWPGAGGGFQGAVEMCNNNGACRKLSGGVMCPSFRVTRNEIDLTRGRANSLRLALSGQLGPDALTSESMLQAMKLCVSCKGCRRECPTGVDMARMKIEVLAAKNKRVSLSLHDRLVGYLPRYAPYVSRFSWLANLRNRLPWIAKLLEGPSGFTATRDLPNWSSQAFQDSEVESANPDIILFADTFNRYFEPDNLRAAHNVLQAAGYSVASARAKDNARPLCCGRTYLSVGLVREARYEAERLLDALYDHASNGKHIVGLEPSCLFTLRDEMTGLVPSERLDVVASMTLTFEEFIARRHRNGQFTLALKPLEKTLWLHGHCHQKAFDVMSDVETTLALIPDTQLETINSSCCGMAGAFGYGLDTHEVSMQMAELNLLPQVRQTDSDSLIVADGTSCRHQIAHGAGREALHVARVLEMALETSP